MKRETIIDKLPSHAECFKTIRSAKIYIRDYKHYDLDLARNNENRGVVIDDNPVTVLQLTLTVSPRMHCLTKKQETMLANVSV